jgi:hypothetical protein
MISDKNFFIVPLRGDETPTPDRNVSAAAWSCPEV